MKRISKKKLGMIGTKKCIRCKEYFFPSRANQKYCPYCQAKPYGGKGRPVKYKRCEILGCKRKHSAKGYCDIHYKQLIGSPKETRNKRLKAAQEWFQEGAIMCEMFRDCEVYFLPRARNQFGVQKICPTCAKKRTYVKNKEYKKGTLKIWQ